MSFPKRRAKFADRNVTKQFDSTLGILNRTFSINTTTVGISSPNFSATNIIATNVTATNIIPSTGYGSANANSATVVERGDGTIFKTVLTISNTAANLANVNAYGVLTFPVYTFPQGAIHVLGATANITVNTNAAANVVQTGSGDFSFGTVAETDETMDGTVVDIIPKTAITDPMVAGVGSGKSFLATAATFDGTTSAKTVNFNFVLDENDLEVASSTGVKVTGTAQIVWINAGDY